MKKRLRNVVRETQQEIPTTVEKDGNELVVEVHACSALDDELRNELHQQVKDTGTPKVSIRSSQYRSNQGNELFQEVTLRFGIDDKLHALDVLDEIVEIGKEFYDRQLERTLAREDDEAEYPSRFINQQKYFDDEALKEFCLLYRGRTSV